MAYGTLTYNNYKPLSILSIPCAMDVAMEIHSLSKSFNMTGFRMANNEETTKSIRLDSAIKGHTDSRQFIPIQKAAAFALDNYKELIEENIKRYNNN